MKSAVQVGEETGIPDERPRPARDLDAHRRSGGSQDEIRPVDAHDPRCRVAAFAHVTHARDLTARNITAPVTTQHATRIQRVHVRVAAARGQL